MSLKKTVVSLLLTLCCASAYATVIDFDDLAGDETVAIANGYQGLNWDNLGAINEAAYPGSGYANGTVSHANTAFNRDGGTASIYSGSAFNFLGAYFTSAWFDQELAFDGYRNGVLVYSTAVSYVIDTTTPLWISLGWNDIDSLVIYNSSGTQWAMDDVTIPEPGSIALLGLALAGLLMARKPGAAA